MVSLINPANGHALRAVGGALIDQLGNSYPIVGGIPRICEPENYAQSFGLQWNKFGATQLDRAAAGLRFTERRFFTETGWTADELGSKDVLEIGSGAGRFTRVVLERTKARLWSIDYSSAVDTNFRNNGSIAPDRLHLFQASIYEMPFPDQSFDKIFCLGVLQHTPDFEASVRVLVSKAKRGGEIVVDFYPIRGWWTKLNAKYLLRPITKRMPNERLLKLIDRNVDWLMTMNRALTRWHFGALNRFLPIADLSSVIPKGIPPDVEREWAVLDTFDMFSPEHDHPQSIADVAEMFRRGGATVTYAGFVDVGQAKAAVVRAVRN